MARIFVVEDHAVMREMLDEFIGMEGDLSICGSASSAGEALLQIPRDVPDLVLIDIALPDMSGISLARALRERYPNILLLMLSGHGERMYVEKALNAGANGYVLKGNAVDIPPAIRQVLSGQIYLSDALRYKVPHTT